MKAAFSCIAVVFLMLSSGFGQSTQSVIITDSASIQVAAAAGQVITVSAVMETTDIAGDTEGDSLVVTLPGTSLTVNDHFLAHFTTFVAPSDNPTVTIQILNGNGHQTGRVNFARSQVNFTQAESSHFALLARLYSLRALAGSTVGRVCPAGPCQTARKVIATGAMSQGKRYSDLLVDADNPRFDIVSNPDVTPLPQAQTADGLIQIEADAYNAWGTNEAQQIAIATAIRTAFNRANTAAANGDDPATRRQLHAAGRFEVALASALNQEPALRDTVVANDLNDGFVPVPIIASQASGTEDVFHTTGLFPVQKDALVAQGFTPSEISAITGELYCKDPTAFTPFFYPTIIVSARVTAVEALVIHDFVDSAVRLGSPLKSDETVEVSGSLAGASTNATFDSTASLTSTGTVAGQFELSFSSAGSSATTIQTNAIQNAVTLGSTILMTGSFVASDGSTQTFFFAADRKDRSVIFGTSNGVNVLGTLQPGQILINNDSEGDLDK